MTRTSPKNLAASVHAKLNNKAKENKLDVNILRTRYALERFLYRLSISTHKEKFTLKGAMLFLLWSDENFRPTKRGRFLHLTLPNLVLSSFNRTLNSFSLDNLALIERRQLFSLRAIFKPFFQINIFSFKHFCKRVRSKY